MLQNILIENKLKQLNYSFIPSAGNAIFIADKQEDNNSLKSYISNFSNLEYKENNKKIGIFKKEVLNNIAYTITKQQFNILDRIYWSCWHLNFDNIEAPEKQYINSCLHWNFKDLAQLKTNINIINTVIQLAKIKSSKNFYLNQLLENNNITVL